MSAKQQTHRKEGIVIEALPNATFRVEIEGQKQILAHLAGKMRMYRIKVLPGDKVIVELPFPEAERGRIVYRKR